MGRGHPTCSASARLKGPVASTTASAATASPCFRDDPPHRTTRDRETPYRHPLPDAHAPAAGGLRQTEQEKVGVQDPGFGEQDAARHAGTERRLHLARTVSGDHFGTVAMRPHQRGVLAGLRKGPLADAHLQVVPAPVLARNPFLADDGVEAGERIQSHRSQRLQAVPLVAAGTVPRELDQPAPDAHVAPGRHVQRTPRIEDAGQRLTHLARPVQRRMSGRHDPGVAPRGARTQLGPLENHHIHTPSRQVPGGAEADDASADYDDAGNGHGGCGKKVGVIGVRQPALP